jgi:hypothetical protein
MRPADRPGLRRPGLVLAAVLVLATLAAGCSSSNNSSSSKPAYCTAASQLKTSVHDLGNVNINVHDLSSVNTAVSKVQADAKTFASEAKSAYPVADHGPAELGVQPGDRGQVRDGPAVSDHGRGGRVIGHPGEDRGRQCADRRERQMPVRPPGG